MNNYQRGLELELIRYWYNFEYVIITLLWNHMEIRIRTHQKISRTKTIFLLSAIWIVSNRKTKCLGNIHLHSCEVFILCYVTSLVILFQRFFFVCQHSEDYLINTHTNSRERIVTEIVLFVKKLRKIMCAQRNICKR